MEWEDLFKIDTLIWWLPFLLIIILNSYDKIEKVKEIPGWMWWCGIVLVLNLSYSFLKNYGVSDSNQLVTESRHFSIIRGDEFEMDSITWFRDGIDVPLLGSWPLNTITYGVLFKGYQRVSTNVSVPCKMFCINYKSLPVASRNKLKQLGWNTENIWLGVPYYVDQYFEKPDAIVQYWMDSSTQLQRLSDLINKPSEVMEGQVAMAGRVSAVSKDVTEKKSLVQKLVDNMTGKEEPGENV